MKQAQLTKQAFEDKWWEEVRRNGGRRVQAYRTVEEEHVKEFGETRYASYNSFATIRDYRLKK